MSSSYFKAKNLLLSGFKVILLLDLNAYRKKIFEIYSKEDFNELVMELFHFQAEHLPIYNKYLQLIEVPYLEIKSPQDIPCLPIEFFKTNEVYLPGPMPQKVFRSSGTTGARRSSHHIRDLSLYKESYSCAFELAYGSARNWTILALLPSYVERDDASLIWMVKGLMEQSGSEFNGFYLNDLKILSEQLKLCREKGLKTLVIGVSFALLDLAEQFPGDYSGITLMETGGMKGRRKELIREELHGILYSAFNVNEIHSEYGMTELLSQAYSKGDGVFYPPPWMRIKLRDLTDPFSAAKEGKSGGIDLIDLANIYSCAFISTQDIGRYKSGGFEVLGRFDDSDIRGCNLMML